MDLLLPLPLLLFSAFAISAERIYQVRLILGPTGIALLLLGRHLLSLVSFLSLLSLFSLRTPNHRGCRFLPWSRRRRRRQRLTLLLLVLLPLLLACDARASSCKRV